MNNYKKLALNDEQKEILNEIRALHLKAERLGLHFVEAYGHGAYAYNGEDVSCFDAPQNASYDNGKVEIDITKLEKVFNFGFGITNLDNDTKCLVAFN